MTNGWSTILSLDRDIHRKSLRKCLNSLNFKSKIASSIRYRDITGRRVIVNRRQVTPSFHCLEVGFFEEPNVPHEESHMSLI